jgi:hypothetical protein
VFADPLEHIHQVVVGIDALQTAGHPQALEGGDGDIGIAQRQLELSAVVPRAQPTRPMQCIQIEPSLWQRCLGLPAPDRRDRFTTY